MKGLYVSILRDASLNGADCTNNGISSKVNRILLVDEKLKGGLYEPEKDEIYLKLVRRNLFDKEYIHAVPMVNGKLITSNSMFGGNFITCSDSRIKELNSYPIPVHDRVEY